MDWALVRAGFLHVPYEARKILMSVLDEACDNSLCRAEGGWDTLEETRAEVTNYIKLQGLRRELRAVTKMD